MTGRALFKRLREAAQYTEALKALPHLLRKPAAVWWGCLCVWETERAFAGPAGEAALAAAIQWVLDPCEETRRLAGMAAAAAGGLETPAGCLAQAACWSGGSMTPPELPVVPPPDHLTAAVVSGAVIVAASRHALHHWNAVQEHFLELGQDVACGRLTWKEPERSPRSKQPLLALVGAEG